MNRFLPSVGMERTTTLELQKNKESMKRVFKEVWSKGNMEVLDEVVAQSKQSEANKRHYDALAQLEKQFVHWRMLSPRIEEEAAGRMGLLTELSKEIGRGGQLHE
jgi:hypothetical protein